MSELSESEILFCLTLTKIPEEYRLALVIYYSHRKSAEATAEILELSAGRVGRLLARGKLMVVDEIMSVVLAAARKEWCPERLSRNVAMAIAPSSDVAAHVATLRLCP